MPERTDHELLLQLLDNQTAMRLQVADLQVQLLAASERLSTRVSALELWRAAAEGAQNTAGSVVKYVAPIITALIGAGLGFMLTRLVR